jgi:hypothetical protein
MPLVSERKSERNVKGDHPPPLSSLMSPSFPSPIYTPLFKPVPLQDTTLPNPSPHLIGHPIHLAPQNNNQSPSLQSVRKREKRERERKKEKQKWTPKPD